MTTKAAKLSPAQQRTWDSIQNAEPNTPDKAYGTPFFLAAEWKSETTHWNGNRVYGYYNTTTLKCLEAKGLIKVHEFGGSYCNDEIERIADSSTAGPEILAEMLECRH